MGTSAEVEFTTSAGQGRHHLLLAAGVECRISSSTDLHIWDQRNKPEHCVHRSAPIYSWEKEGCLAFVQTVDRGNDIASAIEALPTGQRDRTDHWSHFAVAPIGGHAAAVQLVSNRCRWTTHTVVRSGADRSGCCLLGFALLNAGTPRITDLQLQCCDAAAHPCLHGPFRRSNRLGRCRHSLRARPSDDSRSVRQHFILNRRHNGTPYGMLQCQSSGPSTPLV